MDEVRTLLDKFVRIWDQKFTPADQVTPAAEVELLADLATLIRKAWALLT